jgi:hypothetical protein
MSPVSSFKKIPPIRAKMIHVARSTDMKKLTGALWENVKMPKKRALLSD